MLELQEFSNDLRLGTRRQPPQRQLEEIGRQLLEALGEDPGREGLARTPARIAKAMTEMTQGYRLTPLDVIGEGVFAAEGQGLVAVRDVDFHSLCEHHMLPFWGRATVAYYPNEQIVGLSKIPRLVDCFAKRLQVQERLTRQIVEAVAAAISPRAVACRIVGEHMCMRMRGVEKTHGSTATEFVLGEERLTDREKDRLWNALGRD